MSKGEDTRSNILQQALNLSSEVGLEGLTVGALAKIVGMSKSGLYAHFDSKEDLQCQVLDTAASHFVDVVLVPALKKPRGLPRVKTLFERWLNWATDQMTGGCPFIAAAIEFDDRPGQVRDRLVGHLNDVFGSIARAAKISVEEGHFHQKLDVDQFAFEFWATLMAYHHFARLMHHNKAREMADRALTRLLNDAQA